MSEIELHRGTPFLSSEELNRLARQQELSVVIAKASIFDQICQEVVLPEEREAELIQTFLQKESITSDSDLENYLVLRGWQEADLIYVATKAERLRNFQVQVFSQEVELNYLGRKIDLDQVSYSLICTQDADEAFEWHQRFLEKDVEHEHLVAINSSKQLKKLLTGKYGSQIISNAHPCLINRLRVSKPEQIWPPFFNEELWVVLRVDERLGTPLNDAIYAELLDELFDGWLNERISSLLTGEKTTELPLNLLSKPIKSDQAINTDKKSVASQVNEITTLLKKNHNEQARQQSLDLLTEHPSDPNVLLIAHTTHHICNFHLEALKISQKLVDYQPDIFDGYACCVQDLLILNRFEEALTKVHIGLEKFPNHPKLLLAAINAYRASGIREKSLKHAELLITHHPNKVSGYILAAEDLIKLKNPKVALIKTQSGLEKFPNHPKLLIVAINACRALDNRESSLEYAELLITYHPNNFQGYGRAAQDLLKLNRFDEALLKVRSGLDKIPNQLNLLTIATDVYRSIKNLKKSLECTELIITYHPNNFQGYGRAAQDLLKLNRFDEALLKVRMGLERIPNQLNLLTIATDVYRALENREKSLEYAELLITHHPSNCQGYTRAAQELMKLKRFDDALIKLQAGLEQIPQEINLLTIAIEVYRSIKDSRESLKCANLLITHYPDNPSGYIHASEDLIALNYLEEAEKQIRKGLAIFPNHNLLLKFKAEIASALP